MISPLITSFIWHIINLFNLFDDLINQDIAKKFTSKSNISQQTWQMMQVAKQPEFPQEENQIFKLMEYQIFIESSNILIKKYQELRGSL